MSSGEKTDPRAKLAMRQSSTFPDVKRLALDSSSPNPPHAGDQLKKTIYELGQTDEVLRGSDLRSGMLIQGIAQPTWETDSSGLVVAALSASPSWIIQCKQFRYSAFLVSENPGRHRL
ncbi:hypothetical protein [Aromatoleum evansii]|uniref:hypothetical protein n=1 Tax=Aromatoleum evansii TaxID=59406 RepID=UPI00145DB8F5|nr:hypothetical protein [Aromatoleum evansii]NMG31838.1 hypothetical protein [Aromatoleum evansii]